MSVIGLSIYVIIYPILSNTLMVLKNPMNFDDIKSLLSFYLTHRQQGDFVYVYPGAETQFLYYAPKYGIRQDQYIVGEYYAYIDKQKVLDELDSLKTRTRVWFLFAGVFDFHTGIGNEEQFILDYVNRLGKPVLSSRSTDESIYLYDM